MKAILDFFRTDLWRKLLALIFAVILYWNLNEGKQRQMDIPDVPVALQLSPELFLAPGNDVQVRLTVKGPEDRLQKLNFMPVEGRIQVDAGSLSGDGKYRVRLRPENFDCGSRVRVIAIDPAVLTLPLQRKISKDIRVEADISGAPAPGYVRTSVQCVPESVTVTGPENAVNSLTSIRSEAISLEGETDYFENERQLVNPLPSELTLNSRTVHVKVAVKPSSNLSKSFTGIPVRYLFSPLRAENRDVVEPPNPGRVKVTIVGSAVDVNAVTQDRIWVFADLSASRFAEPGEHRVPLEATLSVTTENVAITEISPAEVKVRVIAPPGGGEKKK